MLPILDFAYSLVLTVLTMFISTTTLTVCMKPALLLYFVYSSNTLYTPCLWNSLLAELHAIPSLTIFKCKS